MLRKTCCIVCYALLIGLFTQEIIIAGETLQPETESENTTCFQQIDSLLANDDDVKITVKSGDMFAGSLKQIARDSVVIRYTPRGRYQSAVRQTIKVSDIEEINLNGIRSRSYLLPRSYTLFLFTATGAYLGFDKGRGEYGEGPDTKPFIVGTVLGALIGEAFYRATSKRIPVNIHIQCK